MCAAETDSRPVQGEAWKALALCFLATVAIFIPYVGYSTQTSTIMHDLHMSYVMVGALASIAALAGGILVPLAGVFVDRWGAKNVSVAGLIVSAIGLAWFSEASTYDSMMAARVLEGIGIPMLFLGPYTLALRWAESSNRLGVFMGTMLMTDGVGTIFALYAYAMVLSHYGWRTGSMIGAVAVVVMAGVAALTMKEPPAYSTPTQRQSVSWVIFFKNYLSVVGNRNVLVAAAFLVGVWGTYSIAVYWVPTLLTQQNGWSDGAAGFAGALYPLAGTISAVSFGLISDRLGRRKHLMLISGTGMVACFVVAAAAVELKNYDLLAATLPLSGLFAYGGLPLGYCIAADSVGVKRAATANGFIMGSGLIVGGVVYPLVLGYVKDVTGQYTVGFVVAAGSLLVLNVIAVLAAKDAMKAGPHSDPDCNATGSYACGNADPVRSVGK